jgi:hypothetical protein
MRARAVASVAPHACASSGAGSDACSLRSDAAILPASVTVHSFSPTRIAAKMRRICAAVDTRRRARYANESNAATRTQRTQHCRAQHACGRLRAESPSVATQPSSIREHSTWEQMTDSVLSAVSGWRCSHLSATSAAAGTAAVCFTRPSPHNDRHAREVMVQSSRPLRQPTTTTLRTPTATSLTLTWKCSSLPMAHRELSCASRCSSDGASSVMLCISAAMQAGTKGPNDARCASAIAPMPKAAAC